MCARPRIPQKICLFIHSLEMGGAERVVATLANHWADAGRDVTILTLTSTKSDFYSLRPAIRRVRLTVADERAGNPLTKLIRRFTRVSSVKEALAQIGPDLVIAFMADCNRILALARPQRPTICIGTQHTYAPHTRERLTKKISKRFLYPKLDAVAALTADMAEYLRNDLGLRRVPVIPNPLLWPIPSAEPALKPENVVPRDAKIILAVGRLIPVKGFDVLIDAFATIATRLPDWTLVIVGDGPERDALTSRIDKLGLKGRALLPGKSGVMAEWYAAARMFVLSSHREGLPMALGEALAAGLPCVATDCKTGPSTFIRHDENGLLVTPGDANALAEAMLSVASDPTLAAKLSANAPAARDRFSPETIGAQWDTTYAELSD